MQARGTLNTAKEHTKQSTLGGWKLRSRKAAQIDKPSWPSLPKGNRKEKIRWEHGFFLRYEKALAGDPRRHVSPSVFSVTSANPVIAEEVSPAR